MSKKKYIIIIGSVMLLLIACLVFILIFNRGETPVEDTITVPAGESAFSINLDINEAEPYAGIEFALILSDENALSFASFTPGYSDAMVSPFVEKDGEHYFGFGVGANAFPSGEALAGILNFEGYVSDQPLTVKVVHMNVIRLDEDNKAVTTEKESPAYVFTIQRGN